jgi:hypothetical protein
MDVTPRIACFFLIFLFTSCGNRFDLATERGRQARIDDANYHLSYGQCAAAHEAIDPLYASEQVNDEIRLVKAAAYACQGTFNFLTVVGNIAGVSDYFAALAKSLGNTENDAARSAMYSAIDVLTINGTYLSASNRSQSINDYMVFLQMGVIGTILRNYGKPASSGAQGQALVYDGAGGSPANEMSDIDACALAAAFSHFFDSYRNSSLNDSDTRSFASRIDAMCVAAGAASCAAISKDRTSCNGGNNANSVIADAVVDGVDTAWQ